MTSIVWFRQDLRLADQAALCAAVAEGPVIPVYVLDDEGPGDWRIGGAQRWWLHHGLEQLDTALRGLGSRLILRRGKAVDEIARLAREGGIERVHAIRHYEPWWMAAEAQLADRFDLRLHDGNQLAPPESIATGAGGRYKIFSAFWGALRMHMPPPAPLAAPKAIVAPDIWPRSEKLADWGLRPTSPDWATGFSDWTPGEAGAQAALADFVAEAGDYIQRRDLPAVEGTSRLSPHLHFGEISPATVWHRLGRHAEFLRELAWRDFATGTVMASPDYAMRNGRPAFDRLTWRTGRAADDDFRAWTRGLTGYPIVDAGMRQLWATGWMHNRVRMITASFLVKHLLIDWRRGERWFWDTLLDADLGNNAVNWQWVAGTGTDSNMFGRIMAPLVQSAKFDAGDYIREWVPQLRHLDDDVIHDPESAGISLEDYPAKIVGHREGRERALAAAAKMRG
ncbi:cryptochrome/photolyase family protein [Sphingomonas colocasiae]|uniref:DNA photolyase family protein n=1 Tax=Sphingomonas colocasiae TaxID=1848973 RepID=A0ABS7PI42_9SPHN|nr:deoxyribodipyrimidine photo-lyase [Sphingomonas colocasiae]MBY8820977.1 DNA photolyase family protein [Sphingomonas colocasiae]